MKKLGLWLTSICLIICTAFAFVGCNSGSKENEETGSVQQYVELSESAISIEVYSQYTLKTITNVDKEIEWTTSNAAVATVEDGVVTALSVGSTTITASAGDVSGKCVVTVTHLSNFPELSLSDTSLELVEGGDSVTVEAVALYKGEAMDCTFAWTTANPSVATVENGKITPVGIGTTTITVTTECLGETLTKEISVVVSVDEQIDLSKTELNLTLAQLNAEDITEDTFTAQAYVKGVANDSAALVFESSDETVATVTANGKEATVTAVGLGTCVIGVSYDSANGKIQSFVEVNVTRTEVYLDEVIEVTYIVNNTKLDLSAMDLVGEFEGVYYADALVSEKDGTLDKDFAEASNHGFAVEVELRTDVAVYYVSISVSIDFVETTLMSAQTSVILPQYEGDVTAIGFDEGDTVYQYTMVGGGDKTWENRLMSVDSAKLPAFAHWIVEFSLSDEPTGKDNSGYVMSVWVGTTHWVLVDGNGMSLLIYDPDGTDDYTGSYDEHAANPCVSIYDAEGKIPAKLYPNQKYYFEMHLEHKGNGDNFSFAIHDEMNVYIGESIMCTDTYYQENIAPTRSNNPPAPPVSDDGVVQGDDRTAMPTYNGDVTALGFAEDTTVYVLENTQEPNDVYNDGWGKRAILSAPGTQDYVAIEFVAAKDITEGVFHVWGPNGATSMTQVWLNTREIAVVTDMDGNYVTEIKAGTHYLLRVDCEEMMEIQVGFIASKNVVYFANISFEEAPDDSVTQGESRKPMPTYDGDATSLGFAADTVVYQVVGPQSNSADVKLVAKVDATGDNAYAKFDLVFSKATTSFGMWITASNLHLGYYTVMPTSFTTDGLGDPSREIFVTDANGNAVSAFEANKVYTLYVGLDGREVTVQLSTWADLTMYIANIGCITEAEAPVEPAPPVEGKEISILFIGNSFSDDTEAYMIDILLNLGYTNIHVGNLYIGGCSIDTHYQNILNNADAYDFRMRSHNGKKYTEYEPVSVGGKKKSIAFAIAYRDWDIISVQQASGESGKADSYKNLDNLVNEVKKQASADVEIVFNMTWAYQGNSTHAQFPDYNSNQMTMYNAIVSAVQSKVSYTVIPNGTAIQNARTSLLGDTLTRDGYHLDLNIGRFIAGLTFVAKVTGEDLTYFEYAPGNINATQFAIALESVQNALNNPFTITESEIQEEIVVKDPDVTAGGSNANAVSKYTGDVTSLGFAEGAVVYQYVGVDSSADKAAIKVDSVNYDYVDVQLVIGSGDGYFFLYGLKGGNWHKGGTSYVIDPSWLRFSDGSASDRIIEVFDAQGNKVTSLLNTNTLYTLRVYTKVGELDEIRIAKNGSTIYLANVTQGVVSDDTDPEEPTTPVTPPIVSGESSSKGLSVYTGDVTSLGFDGDTTVYQLISADAWNDRVKIATDPTYKYLDVQFIVASGLWYFNVWVCSAGGMLDGSYLVAELGGGTQHATFGDGFAIHAPNNGGSGGSTRIQVLDANGNVVIGGRTNGTVYTLRIWLEEESVTEIQIGQAGVTMYFANIECTNEELSQPENMEGPIKQGDTQVSMPNYEGDETAVGFEEGEYLQYMKTETVDNAWGAEPNSGKTREQLAAKIYGEAGKYVTIQFSTSEDIDSGSVFYVWGLLSGTYTQDGFLNFTDTTYGRILDENGYAVTSIKKNTVYILELYIENTDTYKVSNLCKTGMEVYFAADSITCSDTSMEEQLPEADDLITAGGSNANAVSKYTGDVTSLGFAEGTVVYQYVGVDSSADKAAIKVDSVNYDYVDVQLVIGAGDGYFFLYGLKGGNWHKGGTSYVIDPSWLRFGDGSASDRIIEVFDAQGNKVTTLLNTNTLYTLRVYTKVGELDEIRIAKNGSTIYLANVTQGVATELPVEGPIKQGDTQVSMPNYEGDETAVGFEEGEYLQYMKTETVDNAWGVEPNSGKTREQLAAKIYGEAGKYVTIQFSTSEDIDSGSVFYVWGLLSGTYTQDGFLNFTDTTYGRILDENGYAVTSIKKNTVYILELYIENTDTYKVSNLCKTGMEVYFAADSITCSDTSMEVKNA